MSIHPVWYAHLTTAGEVLSALVDNLKATYPSVDRTIRVLVEDKLLEHQSTRLDEAGAQGDARPPIHKVFVDLPFLSDDGSTEPSACVHLSATLAENHLDRDDQLENLQWRSHPCRAPTWFVKAGPGQGKSTIGQYIAQAHRAAIILDSKGYRFSTEARQVAKDIRLAFPDYLVWPSFPRIPLAVDLKRYARWLSRREKRDADGVLSYIADELRLLTQEAVSTTLVTTLLEGRRWLAIFDGLDEVPSDEKDRVAREVQRFVREFRQSADLFSICTSRPQGYSGQFDKIPGMATIELVALPDEVALTCARRLLRATRHSSEAEACLARLEAAFRSSSAVRELMRTPLQVHIMCIIARSGQRPPERRWQLYDRFFTVIRQREIARDLPDKRLATLLQQEPKLLRDVHARLGFVLHTRAETSAGATAEFCEADFRRLVAGAVDDAKDENVDDLVETVMRAASERLVLITTPTKAGSYRFDIRQLQEFFAAEYLHTGISGDELRTRLELLGGDQHWREVMHFVLSALAEQDRRTELAIATSAIRRMDRGPDDGTQEHLSRSLSRGATLAARLVQDGVLDEQKAVRNLFRDLLGPLVTTADVRDFESLIQAARREERGWVLDFFCDRAVETVEGESLGAARLLWNCTPDVGRWRQRVQEYFRGCTTETVNAMVSQYWDPIQPTKWQVDCLGDRVLREPVSLGETALWRRLLCVSRYRTVAMQLLASVGVVCTDGDLEALMRRTGAEPGPAIHLASAFIELDAPIVEPLPRAARLWSLFERLPEKGVIGAWKAVIRCACFQTKGSYLTLHGMAGGPELWSRLPPSLPLALTQEDGKAALEGVSEVEFPALLRRWSSDRRRYGIRFIDRNGRRPRTSSRANVADIVKADPSVGLRLLGVIKEPSLQPGLPGLGDSDDLLRVLGESMRVDPALLQRVPIWTWRYFLNAFSTEWASTVLAGELTGFGSRVWLFGVPPEGREDQLPLDSPVFLPRIVSDLARWFWLEDEQRGYLSWEVRRKWRRLGDPNEFLGSVAKLLRYDLLTVGRTDQLPSVRAAATLLSSVTHKDGTALLIENGDLLVELVNTNPSLGPLTAWFVERTGRVYDAACRGVVSRMLEVERATGRQAHGAWIPILQRWRELSDSPVARRGSHMLPKPFCLVACADGRSADSQP